MYCLSTYNPEAIVCHFSSRCYYILIKWLDMLNAPFEDITLLWRHHLCVWSAHTFTYRPLHGTFDLRAGRDLYRATRCCDGTSVFAISSTDSGWSPCTTNKRYVLSTESNPDPHGIIGIRYKSFTSSNGDECYSFPLFYSTANNISYSGMAFMIDTNTFFSIIVESPTFSKRNVWCNKEINHSLVCSLCCS